MKRCAALVLLLGSCQTEEKAEGGPDLVLARAAQISFNPARVKVGEWVRYAVRWEKDPYPRPVSFAAVAGDDKVVWIENKFQGKVWPWILKSKYARGGKLLEQWIGRPGAGETPTKVFPRPDGKPMAGEGKKINIAVRVEQEKVTAGGREYACSKITTSGPDGRDLVHWCAKEVPFGTVLGRINYGGVVRRTGGRFVMELAAMGQDAKEELPIPAR